MSSSDEQGHASASPSGDPAGIGPEIAQKAIDDPGVRDDLRADRLRSHRRGRRPVRARPRGGRGRPRGVRRDRRRPSRTRAPGRIDAIATAPINKEAFAAAGLPWPGHTDLLAHLTGAHAGGDDVLRGGPARGARNRARAAAARAGGADAGAAGGHDRAGGGGAAAIRAAVAAPCGCRAQSARRRARAARERGRGRRSRPPSRRVPRAASTCAARFRPTRSSTGRCGASSTRSSPAITTRG